MSPLLKTVENAGVKGIQRKRKPFHILPEDFFKETETLRTLFSQLINTTETQSIVTVPSVSYAMTNAAKNLSKKGKIIISEHQFPSNVYTWKGLENRGFRVQIIEKPKSENPEEAFNEAIFNAIDSETVALAIAHVHWADGTLFQLEKFRERLNEVGGFLFVDGTQSVGALPFDVQKIQPDILVTAAYKWLMGPYSIGLAYFGENLHNGSPIEEHWMNRLGSENFQNLIEYTDQYQPGALRYEVGEHSNFILVPMLIESLKQVIKWTPNTIQKYCGELIQPLIELCENREVSMTNSSNRANHLFGIQLNSSIEDTAKVFEKNRVNVSYRGENVRISPHVYNDQEDMKKLLKSIKELTN